MKVTAKRLIAGAVTVASICALVALSVGLFRGSFTDTVSVTVLSDRAGLVMNPDAKVKLHGAQVGTVAAIESMPDGQAAIRLAMDPSALELIPANVGVNIGSTTVFGAKAIELIPPSNPSTQSLSAGQILHSGHVTVEINTVFEQLVSVLSRIEPAKLNETLGALSQAIDGRGEQVGQAFADFEALLANLDPSLDNLGHELAVAPTVLNAYADAAPDLSTSIDNATTISDSVVEKQNDLDSVLISTIGLAEIGNEVVSQNRLPITDLLRLLVPTTDLTNEYHQALYCGLAGMGPLAKGPPVPVPGVLLLDSFQLGTERYRYPGNLPKVAATGGPQCVGLPDVGFDNRVPFVVGDTGADPGQYGNQGILVNSDGLKQMLFGPLDGPPRNSAQVGQPG